MRKDGTVAGCYNPEGIGYRHRNPLPPNRCEECQKHSDISCPSGSEKSLTREEGMPGKAFLEASGEVPGSLSSPLSITIGSFSILEFGALDPSAPEGFRRFLIASEGELESLRERYANRDVFASVFRYETKALETSRLYGPFYMDLDGDGDGDGGNLEKALRDARKVVNVLLKLGFPEGAIRIYFSGAKGFHIEVPLEAFGGTPHKDLHKVWRHFSEWIKEYLGGRLES
ncbi:hypothetical protein KEJ19_07465, partial [Candidatus Bathyarchaeota archaeon]|nr:hypothetical protein [Candidatus Bathyarchaeota archaeon]